MFLGLVKPWDAFNGLQQLLRADIFLFFLLWHQVGLALSILASINVRELCLRREMIRRSRMK